MLWMTALGDPPDGPGAVPRFGCARGDLGVLSTAFVGGLTVWEKVRALAEAREPGDAAGARGLAVPLRPRARGVLRRLESERGEDPARADRPDERRGARGGLPLGRAHPVPGRLALLRGAALARRADAAPLPGAGRRALPGAALAPRSAVDRRGRGRGPRPRGRAPLPRRAPRAGREPRRRGHAPRVPPGARPRVPAAPRSRRRDRALRPLARRQPEGDARGPPAARGPDAAALRASRPTARSRGTTCTATPTSPTRRKRCARRSTGCWRGCSRGRGSRRRASSSSRTRRPRSPAPRTGVPSASSSSRDAATLQEAEVAARAGQGAGLRALPRHGRAGTTATRCASPRDRRRSAGSTACCPSRACSRAAPRGTS